MSVSLNNNVAQVNNTQPIKQPEKKTDEKSKFLTPTQTKIAVGTALTALAAVGIYLATKGKGNKATQEVVTEATHNIQETVPETVNTIKEMTVDAFKQAGNKFNKGKAVTTTGETFTGSLTHQTKDGKNIVREYENGVLKKSTKYDGENVIAQKEYKYDENGKISEILSDKDKIKMRHDATTGKLSFIRRNDMHNPMKFYYTKEGNLKYMTASSSDMAPKLGGDDSHQAKNMLIEFDPHTKKPIRARSTNLDGFTNEKFIFYDKSGKPSMMMCGIEQSPKHLAIKDLKNNLEVSLQESVGLNSETKVPMYNSNMEISAKDFNCRINFDRDSKYSKPESVRIILDKKTGKRDSYRLSLDSLKSETADYSINRKKVAKYNVKTGDIEMLPDCGVAPEDVKAQIEELGNQYKTIKKYHRNAYNYKNEQTDLANAIEKSLEDYGDKEFNIARNAGIGR